MSYGVVQVILHRLLTWNGRDATTTLHGVDTCGPCNDVAHLIKDTDVINRSHKPEDALDVLVDFPATNLGE